MSTSTTKPSAGEIEPETNPVAPPKAAGPSGASVLVRILALFVGIPILLTLLSKFVLK